MTSPPRKPAVGSTDWLCGAEVSNEEYERRDVKARPYEVWHEEGEGRPPTFATWAEALAKQVEWNKDCPGHKARRRRAPHSSSFNEPSSKVSEKHEPSS